MGINKNYLKQFTTIGILCHPCIGRVSRPIFKVMTTPRGITSTHILQQRMGMTLKENCSGL